jgi:hypothetical protein
VLEPTQDRIQRFEHKEYRSVRQELVPAPTIVFEHPLTGRLVSLKVLDLSGSGLAVEENARNAVLMPGLMIPRLDLCLASNFRFPCRAQVVYRQVLDPESEDSRIKYGLALLDMDVADHVQLVGLLHQADDRRSYVCNQVDMDELWSFFFETGFIYPQKYGFIQKNREQIKQTYEKLYTRSPSIARHFIYQDRGKILGHMAMVRFYDSTWLIHHHAARSNYTFKAGLNVLDQIGRFITESCRFSFMHMEYVICFYRPENHFPRSVFGGVCRSIDDPRANAPRRPSPISICSATEAMSKGRLGEHCLSPADDDDLRELSSFCQHESGGMMIGALDLEPGDVEHVSDLGEEFGKLGLKRERQLYALKAERPSAGRRHGQSRRYWAQPFRSNQLHYPICAGSTKPYKETNLQCPVRSDEELWSAPAACPDLSRSCCEKLGDTSREALRDVVSHASFFRWFSPLHECDCSSG